ncbi:MAG: alpha/beta hydrolase [Acidimicrobiales bacterium]|nr:alpha/beta hydrolase [Acidimicrobiales bacterium]
MKKISLQISAVISTVLIAALLIVLALPNRSTSASTTTTTSSTSTTTLPFNYLSNSTPSGIESFVGSVRRVSIDGIFLAYREFGSGTPILLIPDRDQTMLSFGSTLLNLLSANNKVILVDLPGIGYSSDNISQPYTVQWVSTIISTFISGSGLSPLQIVGWGLGGQIALNIAETSPKTVTSLVLADTSPGGPGSTPPTSSDAQVLSNPNSTLLERIAALYPPNSGTAIFSYYGEISKGSPETVLSQTIERQSSAEASMANDNSISQKLSSIAVPVLICVGDLDTITPISDSNLIVSGLANATKQVFAGDAHGVPIEDPAKFAAAITTFNH